MGHRVDIRFLRPIAEDEERQVRSFIEDVWTNAVRRDWVNLAELDERVESMEDFILEIPARQSHEAQQMIAALIDKHYMQHFVRVAHVKGGADG